jgi:nucleoside-diphosphate-sugar epimerase
MSTILITGGTGFIGAHITKELLRLGHKVVLLDVKVNDTLIKDIKNKVKIVMGDITIPNQLVEAVNTYEVDAIIHYAALKSSASEKNPQLAYKINFEGLWNVFETARVMDLNTVIFASSIAAYGPSAQQIVKEDTYSIPQTLYGISKQLGEMLGLWFFKKYGIEFVAFRYGSVVGPGRSNGGASAYSTLMIQKPAQGDPYIVNVPEDTRIPIAYIKDVVDATLTAFRNPNKLKTRIFNLVSLSPSSSAKDIADIIKRHIHNAEITFKPDPETTEIISSWPRDLDIVKTQNELGWKPKYSSLDVLVKDFITEVQLNPDIYTVRTDNFRSYISS